MTFTHDFKRASMDTAQPAGRYRVVTDEAKIPGLSSRAYTHAATMPRVPDVEAKTAHRQVFNIDDKELAAALAADKHL